VTAAPGAIEASGAVSSREIGTEMLDGQIELDWGASPRAIAGETATARARPIARIKRGMGRIRRDMRGPPSMG
jgi:hypothetical protein